MTYTAMPTDHHDPYDRAKHIQQHLQETINHLRSDIDAVDDPQLKALFETAAEVLRGLVKSFHDYEQKNEKAWRS